MAVMIETLRIKQLVFISKNFTWSFYSLLLIVIAIFCQNTCAEIRYELHRGPISELHREQLLPLRSTLFNDYPYLYCMANSMWYSR